MKDKVFEDIAIDDVIIQDPNIANQIVQTQKQINDRLKRMAQINSEIATFKQQIGALKDRAIQAQKATMSTQQKAAAAPAPEGNAAPAQPQVQAESYVPSLAEFLNEEEPQFVPHFEDPAGTVYMGGKPRFQKYKKKVEREFTDKDWEKFDEIDKEIHPVQLSIEDLEDSLKDLLDSKQQMEFEMDNLAGQEGMEVMELLSSGISEKEKIKEFAKLGYTAKEFQDLQSELDSINKFHEEFDEKKYGIEGNIKKAKRELNGIYLKQEDIGVSYKDDYMPVEITESLYEEEEEEVDIEFDEDKDENLFFVQIPPQTEIDGEVIAKVFREEEGERWYVRDVENQAEFLDELVFQKNYSKPEIIGYLASIFGDVLEIDQEEFEDIIDDKEELDDKYFPDRKDKNNVRVKLVK
jgi:hypothetical protein